MGKGAVQTNGGLLDAIVSGVDGRACDDASFPTVTGDARCPKLATRAKWMLKCVLRRQTYIPSFQ
ncbi:MAG: hypothetical protein COB66_05085 [Coxiella sp. (in: Bacteria)]|nr:MAG: hypothetical protein COB66_05085 [Coxiella sp. (in: g-proteobacteria)]